MMARFVTAAALEKWVRDAWDAQLPVVIVVVKVWWCLVIVFVTMIFTKIV